MEGYGATLHAAQWTIDPRRSLVVTEEAILARFPFARVMDQLVAQSGVAGLTSLELFQQWWDTQNPGGTLPNPELAPHCDDTVDADGNPILNDFPYACRPGPAEGAQSDSDPFTDPTTNPDAYIPIGLFNRFDLAPADGSHCGEYRIVYAKQSGVTNSRERNLLIFEAILPNPHPKQGLAGCRKIVDFWAKLSRENNVEKRGDELERLYFKGLGNVEPVVHISHYGGNSARAGQVRTNQFMQPADPRVWSLREFKLIRTCNGSGCSDMQFIPVTDKVNPFGPLHSTSSTHPKTPDYQAHFVTQVEGLAAAKLDAIRFSVPDTYNTGQSLASGSNENDYAAHFSPASTFGAAVQAELTRIGSNLTPTDIILRAGSQSCAGCHRLLNNRSVGGGLTWPPSLGFTHVTEDQKKEVVDGQERFVISTALINEFLPQRKQIMEDYLNNKLKKPKKPKDTLSGRKTH
jgi:hypothetical protein